MELELTLPSGLTPWDMISTNGVLWKRYGLAFTAIANEHQRTPSMVGQVPPK
jgi:hypothetical protein